jgi:glycosyltransferase involved in cell wall biosynthesis
VIDEVVLLYAPPWFGATRFSKHHLASYFASRGARVLYVEAPLSPLGLRRGRLFLKELQASMQPPRRVQERLWVCRHFVPLPYHAATPLTSTRAANRIGQKLLAPVLRRDLLRLGFKRPLIVAGLPHAVDCLPLLPRSALVYHCADDYAHVSGFPATLPRLEAELCRQADLVITTSETLCQARRAWNPRTYWIPNGTDIEHFSGPAPRAPELEHLPSPRVGFVGGLSEWVDLPLVADLARRRPAWSFVLIGPAAIDTSPVQALPNVHLLGPRPYADLPSYLTAMDVGVIPFKHNAVTFHADPIKAYEYLAAGLPVVATDLPALHRLSSVVHLANTPDDFTRGIEAALAEGPARRAERQAEAARHSWTARFERFERLLADSVACAS